MPINIVNKISPLLHGIINSIIPIPFIVQTNRDKLNDLKAFYDTFGVQTYQEIKLFGLMSGTAASSVIKQLASYTDINYIYPDTTVHTLPDLSDFIDLGTSGISKSMGSINNDLISPSIGLTNNKSFNYFNQFFNKINLSSEVNGNNQHDPDKDVIESPFDFDKSVNDIIFGKDNLVDKLSEEPSKKNKVGYPTSYTRNLVGAGDAEEVGLTGRGIKIAVLDTGINTRSRQVARDVEIDNAMRTDIQADTNGHGTHVSTTAFGKATINKDNISVKGVAPDAHGISIKVLGHVIGSGRSSDIIKGLEIAYLKGADIISMSLGFGIDQNLETDPSIEDPISKVLNKLVDRGVIPVVAAGNCISANSWILIENKHITVHNLYQKWKSYESKNNPNKKKTRTKIMPKIINYNVDKKKFELDEIIGVYKRNVNEYETVYRITTDESHIIEATNDHPFLTHNGWKKCSELKINDEIIVKPDTPDKFKVNDWMYKTNPTAYIEHWNKGGNMSQESIDEIRNNIEPIKETLSVCLVNGAKVTKIEIIKRENVYDIATKNNHTLVVNGLVLHNSGSKSKTISLPGGVESVLTVGAYNPRDSEIASFSSRGDFYNRMKPDIIAPGVNIFSTTSYGSFLDLLTDRRATGYATMSGTSMATPHVAGLIALIKQAKPDLTMAEIKNVISVKGHKKNNDTGYGKINFNWFV